MSRLEDVLNETNERIVRGFKFIYDSGNDVFKLVKIDGITNEDGKEDQLIGIVYDMDTFFEFLEQS